MRTIGTLMSCVVFAALLGACGDHGNNDSPNALEDAFVSQVKTIAATAPDDAEPQATDGIAITQPEDTEPVSL